MAVTGLPQPQPDHAVRMMKFAADCIDRMKELVHGKLVDELGADTATLAMRVGCHTGSVTGGVLRGDKGRFQLFGDTMNTAAVGSLRIGKHLDERFCFFSSHHFAQCLLQRMESNGVPNRIHVSQETRDELVARGKGHWLVARPEKIFAKGKGDLQTYFCVPVSAISEATSQVSASPSNLGSQSVED